MNLFSRWKQFLQASLGFSFLLATTMVSVGESPVKRLLYMSSPDGAQNGGNSGKGLMVFDIDDGHKFVRRIDIPSFGEGMRGLTGSVVTKCLYFSTTNHRLGCFDLETNQVKWEKTFDGGCDRSCVSADGSKIYVPTGWWWGNAESGFIVVNAADGSFLKRIPVGPKAHNSIASLDGKYVFLGTETRLTMFNAKDESIVHTIDPVGESGVFPFTIDHANRFAYVCLGKHVGFDMVDLSSGKVIHRVMAGKEPIGHRTHGAGLTPDESELWISDQDGKKLFVFDATQTPPREKTSVELSAGGHGWVTFSLDGAYAYCHTPDIFDARTKKLVTQFKDESGKLVSSSKFIEVHVRDGKVVAVGNEFGLGRKP